MNMNIYDNALEDLIRLNFMCQCFYIFAKLFNLIIEESKG